MWPACRVVCRHRALRRRSQLFRRHQPVIYVLTIRAWFLSKSPMWPYISDWKRPVFSVSRFQSARLSRRVTKLPPRPFRSTLTGSVWRRPLLAAVLDAKFISPPNPESTVRSCHDASHHSIARAGTLLSLTATRAYSRRSRARACERPKSGHDLAGYRGNANHGLSHTCHDCLESLRHDHNMAKSQQFRPPLYRAKRTRW